MKMTLPLSCWPRAGGSRERPNSEHTLLKVDNWHRHLAKRQGVASDRTGASPPHLPSARGFTPLHTACRSGDAEAVNVVLAGIDVDGELLSRRDTKLRTPLHHAAKMGHIDAVMAVLAAAEAHLRSSAQGAQGLTDFVNARDYKQQTALYQAAKMGHATVVEQLLIAGADLSLHPELGIPVLHLAAERSHAPVVNVILDQCRDLYPLQEQDSFGRTLLHIASRRGLQEIVQRLREYGFEGTMVDVNAKAKAGITPLHLAVYCGHLEVVKLLLAWPEVDVEAQTAERLTAFHLAADAGHAYILRLLVATESCKSCINAEDCVGRTPLHYACRTGEPAAVEALLQVETIDVNIRDCVRSFTPLHLAAWRGYAQAVKLLLENPHCPPDTECKIGGPQDRIKREELKEKLVYREALPRPRLTDSFPGKWNTEEVDWLERFKGEHNSFSLPNKRESLYIELYNVGYEATSLGRVYWTQYEISCYREQSTALHLAAQNDHLEVVTELLAYPKINVNATDIGGRTPLHFAAAKGHLAVLKALIAKPGIHLNAVTLGGPGMLYPCETPLHLAVHMERLEIVDELCRQPRVRGNRKNWQNRTPLDLAWEKPGDSAAEEIRELLMKHRDVQRYVEGLFKDRDLFQNAANAVLVGGTMIASVAFTGIIQPPVAVQHFATTTSRLEQRVARVFLISNTLSFTFAILSVASAIHMLLPIVRYKQEPFIADGVAKIRRRVAFTSFVFTIALIFVVVAYFQAGYSLMSTAVQKQETALLVGITSLFLIPIMLSLVKDYLFFLHENIVEFWLSDSLKTLSETLHYQTPFLRPLFYHLVFLVSLLVFVLIVWWFFHRP